MRLYGPSDPVMRKSAALVFAAVITGLSHVSCQSTSDSAMNKVTSEMWGEHNGQKVELFTLTNKNGMEAKITNYGGIIVSLTAPDRTGSFADVVLGFDSLERYVQKNPFFGCITGRYANRIGGASFKIDGKEFHVTANSGKNHIHGGKLGFDKKVWKASKVNKGGAAGVTMRYRSADGEEGYPGNLDCTVAYVLTDDNALEIEYTATTDAPTVVNLTNHSYFNLAGEGSSEILRHEMMINADQFTPTDVELIPTGALESVIGTPLDFTVPRRIGERIAADFEPLRFGKGYDHNYVLSGRGMKLAARARDPKSGRVMEVHTSEPGIQFYTANHLNTTGKKGHTYGPRSAFCLETQRFPDSPNKPSFPTAVLRPGDAYQHTTVFKFSAE